MSKQMKNNQTTAAGIWRAFLNNEAAELVAVATPVIRQLGGVNADTLCILRDVSRSPYGAAGGYTGFIYYTETVAFWRKNRARILSLMSYEAEAIDGTNALTLCRSFKGIKEFTTDEIARALYGRFNDEFTAMYNVFAWYALEEVAYRFGEYVYEEGIDIYSL